MKKQSNRHQLDGLTALLLFGVFAACVLVVLLSGADAYRRLTARDQASYDRRTCVQYLATRVRQADALEGVAVEEFGGGEALVLADGDFLTRVYCYEGYLMELYTDALSELGPEAGERVMALDGLELRLERGLLTAEVTDTEGGRSTIRLSLRSGEGAAVHAQ